MLENIGTMGQWDLKQWDLNRVGRIRGARLFGNDLVMLFFSSDTYNLWAFEISRQLCWSVSTCRSVSKKTTL